MVSQWQLNASPKQSRSQTTISSGWTPTPDPTHGSDATLGRAPLDEDANPSRETKEVNIASVYIY